LDQRLDFGCRVVQAPEISQNAMALTLLIGGLLVLRGRRAAQRSTS
jgi:hypothetical protein